jgi:hypothetical protein
MRNFDANRWHTCRLFVSWRSLSHPQSRRVRWFAAGGDHKANAIPRYDKRLDTRARDRNAFALAVTDHGRSDCFRSHNDPLRLWSINRFN